MLSAVIPSVRSQPALLLAEQLAHQRYVRPGPLVLGTAFFKFQRARRIETELSHDGLNPARVPLSWANSPTLGTYSRPRMRLAEIDVPTQPVDLDSCGSSDCYPRGTFYPLSDTSCTSRCRITSPDVRPCSPWKSHRQAHLCNYTHLLVANQAEGGR